MQCADDETQAIWEGRRSRALPPEIQGIALRKLRILARAATLADLTVPRGNRLERLKGDRKGRYSIRINDQWRITFAWVDGGADDVRIEDYH
jgi:proteic killer suppression protein